MISVFSLFRKFDLVFSQFRKFDSWQFLALIHYRNDFYICGVYGCVNSGESLSNWVKQEGLYVKFVNDSPEFTRR